MDARIRNRIATPIPPFKKNPGTRNILTLAHRAAFAFITLGLDLTCWVAAGSRFLFTARDLGAYGLGYA